MPKLFHDKYNLIVPSITPIIKGKVDYSSLKALFNFLIESKVDLIFILGTTGEFIVLSLREKLDIIKFSIDHIRYKIPLLVGVSAKTEEEMQKLIKETNTMEFGTIVVTLSPSVD